MGNSLGRLFRITTWGESHGGGVGVVVDGCPANIDFPLEAIQHELSRRRPGQNHLVTPRKEADEVIVLSGVFEGKTLGTPISMMVFNKDPNPNAYNHLKDVFRPSHADFTFQEKFGIRNWQGGGRSSARETIGRVAAGALAAHVLNQTHDISVISYVSQIHTHCSTIAMEDVTSEAIEESLVRCPEPKISDQMVTAIEQARKDGDSLGGIIVTRVTGVPAGIGEPVFDKLKSELAKAMLSIPAVMGFEFGSGFSAVSMKGSEHNDAFYNDNGRIKTRTNNSGGIQGGISNGEAITFRTAFKPTATIFKEQETVTSEGDPTRLAAKGRHDPCVLPRAVPIVDAMTHLVLLDQIMLQNAREIG